MKMSSSSKSVSGLVTTSQGERVVAASLRPDGTVRKERKIRPGYTPPEDVERYTNARVAASKVPVGYVPGRPIPSTTNPSVDKSKDTNQSKSAKKNEKRKLKRANEREEKLAQLVSGMTVSDNSTTDGGTSQTVEPTQPQSQQDSKEEIEKKLRMLRKKLRQIEALEEKLAAGETLLEEQQDKITKKPSLLKDISDLENQLK